MKIRIQYPLVVLIFGMATIILSTYASDRVNLVEKGIIVLLEYVPSKGVYVSKAYVYQDGKELVISGKVKRHYGTSVADRGHVDIAVLSPDGTILKQVSTMYVPQVIRRKGSRDVSFTKRLPIILPQGTIVRAGFHSSVDKTFNCK